MNSKPLYQPWNEEEFQADRRVRRMTPRQRAMYRTLLQSAFFESTRPYLPVVDEELWLIADAETLEEWQANSKPVRDMFYETTHPETGEAVLVHRRLLEDWHRIMDKREEMAALGRKSQAKRKLNGSSAVAQRSSNGRLPGDKRTSNEVSEVSKRSEEKRREESSTALPAQPEESEEHMNARRKIEAIALRTVGQAERWDDTWRDVKVLFEAFGSSAVVDAFSEWAVLQEGIDFNGRPIGAFLKVAASILAKPGPEQATPFNDLLARLAEISKYEVKWTDGQKVALNKLLKSYHLDDIVAAFRLFYVGIQDDFDLKWAARNFVETSDQWVLQAITVRTMRERQEQIEKQTEEQGRQELNADLAARRAKDAEAKITNDADEIGRELE